MRAHTFALFGDLWPTGNLHETCPVPDPLFLRFHLLRGSELRIFTLKTLALALKFEVSSTSHLLRLITSDLTVRTLTPALALNFEGRSTSERRVPSSRQNHGITDLYP